MGCSVTGRKDDSGPSKFVLPPKSEDVRSPSNFFVSSLSKYMVSSVIDLDIVSMIFYVSIVLSLLSSKLRNSRMLLISILLVRTVSWYDWRILLLHSACLHVA
jgi:hypothetical protein